MALSDANRCQLRCRLTGEHRIGLVVLSLSSSILTRAGQLALIGQRQGAFISIPSRATARKTIRAMALRVIPSSG